MTDRKPGPATSAKILVSGLSVAAGLGLVGAMGVAVAPQPACSPGAVKPHTLVITCATQPSAL